MKLLNLLMDEAKGKEDGKGEGAMDVKCPRKLNLNLPLLSTRRLGSSTCETSSYASKSWDMARDRVPFSWEQAPGKPKNHISRNDIYDSMDGTPRPELPACRWRPKKQEGIPTKIDDAGSCEADADRFSDAVDALSLTEAIDIAQKAENDRRLDSLNLESGMDSITDDNNSYQSYNFMMERFLPDATAIAASSVLYLSKELSNNKVPFSFTEGAEGCGLEKPVEGRLTCSNSESHWKGCGLEIFHPGRMKHKFCGVKSPVKEVSSAVQSWKCNAGKHKKHFPT